MPRTNPKGLICVTGYMQAFELHEDEQMNHFLD